MSYSEINFSGELLSLIAAKKSLEEIAKWAHITYIDNARCCYKEIEVILSDLSIIDTPGFEMSYVEMIEICVKLLNSYLEKSED